MARAKDSVSSVVLWDAEAATLAGREQWKAAARVLKRAAQAVPHDAARWKQVAEWQVQSGDIRAAIRTLEQALKLNLDSTATLRIELWLALAETHLAGQNWELGAQACGEILRLSPRHHAALELLATTCLQTNQLDAAIEAIELLLLISPRDPLHRLKLATLLQLQGRLGESSQEFQRVLELYPTMPFSEDAEEAVEALDRLQTQQILMMASEQTTFRLKLERAFDMALAEGGFHLSDNGRESLRHMVADVNFDSPIPPRLH